MRRIAGCAPPLGAYDADIIILSLNRLGETIDAVRSALAQRGVRHHITVLDQGSTEETLRGLKAEFAKAANFALYRTPENLGVAGGRNLATSLGHGSVIIALDSDAVLAQPWIAARAVRAFQQQPDLGALGFNILAADGMHPDRFSWGYPKRLLSRFRERFDTTTFVGAGHAIRRVTWNKVGGYDPDLFFTWEEYDFCLAAIALNWRIRYDGTLTVIHNISPSARVPWEAARTRLFIRNRLIIARKWGTSWLALTPRILAYLIKAGLDGRLRATASGIAAALAGDPPRKRKMPKAMRRYLAQNESRHRGSWLERLRTEILAPMRTDP